MSYGTSPDFNTSESIDVVWDESKGKYIAELSDLSPASSLRRDASLPDSRFYAWGVATDNDYNSILSVSDPLEFSLTEITDPTGPVSRGVSRTGSAHIAEHENISNNTIPLLPEPPIQEPFEPVFPLLQKAAPMLPIGWILLLLLVLIVLGVLYLYERRRE